MKEGQETQLRLNNLPTSSSLNEQFFRQAETQHREMSSFTMKNYDRTIEKMVADTARALLDELNDSVGVIKRQPEYFVDHYGKEQPGYINFNEFKEIYKNHVHYADGSQRQPPEENKMRALSNAIDPD